jgi:hypothetical protein
MLIREYLNIYVSIYALIYKRVFIYMHAYIHICSSGYKTELDICIRIDLFAYTCMTLYLYVHINSFFDIHITTGFFGCLSSFVTREGRGHRRSTM